MAIIGMLVLTVLLVLGVSFIVNIIWGVLFAAQAPTYISGLLGGIAALPAWLGLRRIRKRNKSGDKET